MIEGEFEVWTCVKDSSLSTCATHDWSFCYVHDEVIGSFVPWVSFSLLPNKYGVRSNQMTWRDFVL